MATKTKPAPKKKYKQFIISCSVTERNMQRFNALLRSKQVTASAYVRGLIHEALEKEGV